MAACSYDGNDYHVVHATAGGLDDRNQALGCWGIVRRIREPSGSAKYECTDCDRAFPAYPVRMCLGSLRAQITREGMLLAGAKQSCPHIRTTNKEPPRLSAADGEAMLQRFIDPATGRRRLTCVSRCPVPERIDASERFEQWQGAPSPSWAVCIRVGMGMHHALAKLGASWAVCRGPDSLSTRAQE
jgi:hypothetical protein